MELGRGRGEGQRVKVTGSGVGASARVKGRTRGTRVISHDDSGNHHLKAHAAINTILLPYPCTAVLLRPPSRRPPTNYYRRIPRPPLISRAPRLRPGPGPAADTPTPAGGASPHRLAAHPHTTAHCLSIPPPTTFSSKAGGHWSSQIQQPWNPNLAASLDHHSGRPRPRRRPLPYLPPPAPKCQPLTPNGGEQRRRVAAAQEARALQAMALSFVARAIYRHRRTYRLILSLRKINIAASLDHHSGRPRPRRRPLPYLAPPAPKRQPLTPNGGEQRRRVAAAQEARALQAMALSFVACDI
ncbi:hypothetical protein PVAP13_2NG400603 [Panicum virgatum]|uniref:Uncharacterized protein n=1 Tax=Panicum virgatum TaxID=38727 RepID=A0A8T0VFR2_PANVG|nr:hypothetical protein PVAP13_2NG400603 [Panicum virgatum]